jgi:sarcosine oxidase
MPPDRDFVVDNVPGADNVLVALGAAHGFKFAALFGQILEELAIDGNTSADLSLFKIDRPILKRRDPPGAFLL